jgi:LAO/AO transport system kinase
VPEAGDEVQTMKAGLMEIADIFVVNKSDRPGADAFVKTLRLMLAPAFQQRRSEVKIVSTVASAGAGIADLYTAIKTHQQHQSTNERKAWLLAEKAYQLIQQNRMRDIDRRSLREQIKSGKEFNLYRFVASYA